MLCYTVYKLCIVQQSWWFCTVMHKITQQKVQWKPICMPETQRKWVCEGARGPFTSCSGIFIKRSPFKNSLDLKRDHLQYHHTLCLVPKLKGSWLWRPWLAKWVFPQERRRNGTSGGTWGKPCCSLPVCKIWCKMQRKCTFLKEIKQSHNLKYWNAWLSANMKTVLKYKSRL